MTQPFWTIRFNISTSQELVEVRLPDSIPKSKLYQMLKNIEPDYEYRVASIDKAHKLILMQGVIEYREPELKN